MKLSKLALTAIMLASAGTAGAASLTIGNLDFTFTGNDLPFVDNAGNALSSGFFAVYQFSGGAPTDFTSLQTLGDTPLFQDAIGPGNAPVGGFFNTGVAIPNNGSLNGVNLFLVVGNGADLVSSSQLGLVDMQTAFTRADSPLPDSQTAQLTSSTPILVGAQRQVTLDFTDFGNAAYSTTALSLAIVPEPSSSLLFGLAGLALLIRRKR